MSRITFFKNFKEDDINKFHTSTIILKLKTKENDFTRIHYDYTDEFDFLYDRFNNITYALGKTIRLAEIINYELSTAIFIYTKNKYNIDSLCSLSKECERIFAEDKTFKGFSFAKFAFLLSAILKIDADFYKIEELNTREKRKLFTKTLNYFIEERNYFAHGHLELIGEKPDAYLKVVHQNKDYYIKLSQKLLNEYLKTFKFLLKIIYNINIVSSNIPF
ncbi:hypothetical protein [Flavobacterium sp. AG291]|uniref:hypothetical protein n=1 Tax=Flavobacterium sp. AG291 TaxID=2184000 RepID=UPI000E0AB263|nr:hypothetical protein [Flavobacterium sp. AG291]RDI13110.1 hypothetical protein DEU42_10320 [Flavobacterium sp. AG291]